MTDKTLAEAEAAYDHWGDIALDPEPEAVRGYIVALRDALNAKDAEIARLREALQAWRDAGDHHSFDDAVAKRDAILATPSI